MSSPFQVLRSFASLSNRGSPKSPMSSSPLGKLIGKKGSGGKTPEKQKTPCDAEEVTETPKGAKTLEQVTEKDNAEDQQVSQPQVPSQETTSRPSCNVVTPSRYCAIASLDEAAFDEEEEWKERTSIITKIDHELYQRYAQEFPHHITDEAVARAKPTATPTETDDRSK